MLNARRGRKTSLLLALSKRVCAIIHCVFPVFLLSHAKNRVLLKSVMAKMDVPAKLCFGSTCRCRSNRLESARSSASGAISKASEQPPVISCFESSLGARAEPQTHIMSGERLFFLVALVIFTDSCAILSELSMTKEVVITRRCYGAARIAKKSSTEAASSAAPQAHRSAASRPRGRASQCTHTHVR